jgi:hypothetical protein
MLAADAWQEASPEQDFRDLSDLADLARDMGCPDPPAEVREVLRYGRIFVLDRKVTVHDRTRPAIIYVGENLVEAIWADGSSEQGFAIREGK